MVIKAHVKRNTYFDSITLMKIAHILTGVEGVEDAAAIMATRPNLQLLAEAGLTPFEEKASPEDVLLVVRASDESCAEAALQAAEKQLGQRVNTTGGSEVHEPKQLRSLEQVAQLHPDTQLAVISVPGPYAALEAHQALRTDLHVFLFSDNVSLEDEIVLKRLARERSLLLMGPDCGTAMLNGVGLGFVNVVPRGAIGIVGASGTGIQQVMSLIAQQGKGISQVIGCGGRDLSEAVGAITTLQGLQLLEEDEQTERIVLISKPPAQTVAERVLEVAARSKKTVIVIFVGLVAAALETLQSRYGGRVIITHTLTEAARYAVGEDNWRPQGESYRVVGGGVLSSGITTFQEDGRPVYTRIVGLFSGGTLCDEAMHIWAKRLGPIYSNIPLKPEWQLMEEQQLQGHCAIDFGADEYTRGRPHPMIDPSLRLKRLQEEANNLQGSVILLDIVLGYCSHPDPASVYVPAIALASQKAEQAGRALTFVISLCGTEDDPQRFSVQAVKFKEVGAEVFTSNAEAAMRCIEIVS
ncbi:MAG: acyl-CoA synthetase FdrA [Ktedonobacteraceae bacterium]